MTFKNARLLRAALRWRRSRGPDEQVSGPLEQLEGPTQEFRTDTAQQIHGRARSLIREPDLIRGIERVVAASIGARVRRLDGEVVRSPRRGVGAHLGPARIHTTHRLEVEGGVEPRWTRMAAGGRITVFVKAGQNLEPSPGFLNEVESEDFRTPYCFGAFVFDDMVVEVSEHIDGERVPFGSLPETAQTRLMRAVAGVNAIRADETRVRMRWLSVPLEWFEERCAEHGGGEPGPWRGVLERIRRIDGVRGDVDASIRGDGRMRLFTHNDLNANNVLFAGERRVRVIDWEKAGRSLPGADLRFLLGMESRELLLDRYLERMDELGFALDRARVLRVIDVTEGFRKMRVGCANGLLTHITSGLALVETHVPP